MMSLQIRRTPSKENVIAPIAIPNNKKAFFSHHITDQFTTPMPGSAPSVLLPGKDPFDIPYDPQEEKPDLTGGSFDQEFISPDPKDAVFSRHDSFGLRGGHHPWPQISFTNNHRARNSLVPDNNKDTDKIIEIESCHSPESDSNKINPDCIIEEIQSCDEENHNTVVHDPNYKYSSTSSEEEKEGISDSTTKGSSMNKDHRGSSQMEYILHNSFSSSSHHQPANSIESDLQVEVSEVSSPPRSNSSLDIGSSIEEEEDVTYGKEPTWETSSQPNRNHDVEENPGLISASEEYKDILVPHELADNINDDISDSFLRLGSKDGFPNSSQKHDVSGSQMEVKENSYKPSPESSQASPSGNSAFTVFEKQMPHHQVHNPNSSINGRDPEVELLNMNNERTGISTSSENESQNNQFDENDATEIPEDKGESSEKQEEMDEPVPIEDKHTVESNEGGEHTTEDRISVANESFNHQAAELQPTPELQEVPEVSSPISSPRSVLQPKLSADHISNILEDLQSGIQQLETQIVENNMAPVEREESPTSAIPTNATVSRENSMSPSSLDGLEAKASQEFSLPSSSAQSTDSLQFAYMAAAAEHEITQNETRDIPECTMENITSPVTLVDLQKPVEESNPSILDVINDNLVEHHTNEVSPAVADPNERLNESSLSVNTEESSHHSKSVTEVNSPPPSEPNSAITEHEVRRDNTMEIPDSTTIEGPEKLREAEADPSTLNHTNEKSHEPHEDVPPPPA